MGLTKDLFGLDGPEINFGRGFKVHLDLTRYRKLFNVPSLFRDIKYSGLQIWTFLRPKLFKRTGSFTDSTIFVKDIKYASESCHSDAYADDTNLLLSSNSVRKLYNCVNKTIVEISI